MTIIKPNINDTGWGVVLNTALDVLDTAFIPVPELNGTISSYQLAGGSWTETDDGYIAIDLAAPSFFLSADLTTGWYPPASETASRQIKVVTSGLYAIWLRMLVDLTITPATNVWHFGLGQALLDELGANRVVTDPIDITAVRSDPELTDTAVAEVSTLVVLRSDTFLRLFVSAPGDVSLLQMRFVRVA